MATDASLLQDFPTKHVERNAADPRVTVIRARTGWRLIDWHELRDYRDLFLFLTWRHIKVQYAVGAASAVTIAVTGCSYFRCKERLFAEVA